MTTDIPADWVGRGLGTHFHDLRHLARGIANLGATHLGRRWVWRGVPDASWRVQSTLWRHLPRRAAGDPPHTEEDVRDFELRVLRKARQWGLGLSGTNHVPDLQLLASLQHHGAPTRLLDVTINPYTALWFAVAQAKHRHRPGALMAIDVTGIPVHQTVPLNPTATYGNVEDPLGWTLTSALHQSRQEATSFLVQPTVRDARMTAQEGLFLASAVPDPQTTGHFEGVDGFALNPAKTATLDATSPETHDPFDAAPTAFHAFVIPPGLKLHAQLWLARSLDRTERTVFPDLAGIAAHYRDRKELADAGDPYAEHDGELEPLDH